MGKINILCYALGLVFGSVALGIALTIAQDSWKSDQHLKGLLWSSCVAVLVVAAAFVGSLPMALEADEKRKNSLEDNPTSRAWVTVTECVFKNLFEADKTVVGEIVIKNTGQIPAVNVSAVNNVGIGELPAEMPIGEPKQRSIGVLAPNVEWTGEVTHHKKRTVKDIEDFRNGPYRIFMFGRITYRDAFQIDRQTDYCFEADRVSGETRICDRWNTAK